MSYNEDFDDIYSKTGKIPYDDTPISRPVQTKKSGIFKNSKNNTRSNSKFVKILSAAVAVLVCLNVIMICIMVYSLRKGGDRYITVLDSTITVSGETNAISAYSVQTAWYSSVCIAAGGKITDYSTFFTGSQSRGSGVIYKKDNNNIYIVTCQHVVDGYENDVYVLFSSYLKPVKAIVVGYTVDYDVAVLKVTNSDNYAACLPITAYNSQNVSIGETVFAVGNSLSGGLSATSGIVSRINKEISVDGTTSREIQTSAAINPGNSGGGLFNAEGKFIGLVNAKLSSAKSGNTTITVEGTSYAIPGTLALSIANSIIKNNGSPRYAYIGAEFAHDDLVSSMPLPDNKIVDNYRVVVSRVSYSTTAYGKLSKDDEIEYFTYTNLDGVSGNVVNMYNMYCYEDVCFDIEPNSTIYFKIAGKQDLVGVSATRIYTQN